MKSIQIRLMVISLGMFLIYSFSSNIQAQTPAAWNIPAKFKTTKNPVAAGKEAVSEGKDLYAKHCKSCHGSAGLGDGPKAASLEVTCSDFSTKKFQAQADGEIFFQMSEGKGKMPSFKKLIPEDNGRWSIVYYLRTMAAK
ncbi:MAG: cytochrome c [Bacteroidetes bacterium]|nr:cytochrome c [Bacteroidota bacterium]